MITKEKVKKIVEKYIEEKKVSHTRLVDDAEKITLYKNKKIAYGGREGEIADLYAYGYLAMWTQEEKYFGVYVDAHTGELLYIMTPHWYIDIED
ncbi:hypothetical protein OX283_009595 [Flavobacterium sp. SUN052]|uniref:hypothetical protein n=1 Tax=Flavobacterium sp. SUN052 TaxID=3002441 RepID=UPI00237D5051|nr:hypothetical protein [Flavobacterium sp. SUN052]MEC4004908.1 hypothetical protein [Flavobacterium sp. SUN052]